MLDSVERKNIDEARDILVGKIPDPKAQVEQITIGMIYKFMSDIDLSALEFGGEIKFFTGEFEKYAWNKLFDRQKSAHDVLNLYRDALASMSRNPNIPQLFRQIFDKAFLSYNDPGTLKLFLDVINRFSYNNPENLGNAFEYLLSILSSQGDAGQFRTPRNIIEFMVDVTDPQKNDKILDPACGTGGFLIYAWRHILKYNSSNFNPEKDSCSYENSQADIKDHVINGAAYKGDNLTYEDMERLSKGLEGYDISPDMVRLALVNMYLHNIKNPKIAEYDTLTSDENWNQYFDCVFSNPPFMSPKGGIRPHGKFSIKSSRSEVLFVDYIMNHLSTRGKAAVIVPEGIIFQSQNAYKELRKELVENYLIAVVSLPAGVFNPYSGVKTSVLLLDRQLAKKADGVLFVKVENDGYGLGAQRKAINKNDLPKSARAIKAYKAALNKGMEFTPEEFDNALLTPKSKIAENGEFNLSGERYKEIIIHKNEYPFVQLSDICDFNNGLWSGKKEPFIKAKVIRNTNFQKNGYIDWSDIAELDVELKHFENRELAFGDIIIEKSGGGPTQPVGRVVIFNRNVKGYSYSNFTSRIRCSKNEIKAEFLWLMLRQFYYDGKTEVFQNQTSGIRNLDFKLYQQIQIPLPPLSVQEEIVAEIEGYQKIIDGARQVVESWKPKIDIDPEWPMVELGEVCEIKSGGTPSRNEIAYWNGEIPWVGSTVCKDKYVESAEEFITELGLINSSAKIFKAGTTLIALVGATIGKTGYLDFDSTTNQNIAGLIPNNKDNLLNKYLWYACQTIYNNFLCLGDGKFRMATLGFVREQKIALPDLETQNQIVTRIEEEQAIVNGNKRLIEIYEQKIKDRIAKVWGE